MLFLVFVWCMIFFSGVWIRYFWYTDFWKQTIADLKDIPRQWKEREEISRQTDQYYQWAQTISGFDWNNWYSGTMIVPKVLIPELYQTPRIKILAKNIYDYNFTWFVVRNTGTGSLWVILYWYDSSKKRLTFGQSIMKNMKNIIGKLLLWFYDYRIYQWPYYNLWWISLPSSYWRNDYSYSIWQCVQFFNEKHYGIISSDTILPWCVVKLYNQRDYDILYDIDQKTEFNLMLSFMWYYNSDTIEMSYSIEPMN